MSEFRRSSPGLYRTPHKESLSELYPSAHDSDPKELKDLMMRHARKHEQHVETFISHNTRLASIEEQVKILDDRDDRIENRLEEGFASLKLEFAVARAQVKSTLATVAAIWGVIVVILGVIAKFVF